MYIIDKNKNLYGETPVKNFQSVKNNETILRDFFTFRNKKISYLYHKKNNSSKPIIILAHANGYSAYSYKWYMENLAENYSIYAMDFWGHSFSEGNISEKGFKGWLLFRDQILAFINEKKFKSVIMIGHSLGGGSSILAASKNPKLFSKIIALDPVVLNFLIITYSKIFSFEIAEKAKSRRSHFKNLDLVRKAYRKSPAFKNWNEQIYEDYLASAFHENEDKSVDLALDPAIESKIFSSASFRNVFFRLKNIKTEIHIITPEKSRECPRQTAKRIIKKNPKSSYETFPDITHFFPFEKPEWTLEQIKKYLKGNLN